MVDNRCGVYGFHLCFIDALKKKRKSEGNNLVSFDRIISDTMKLQTIFFLLMVEEGSPFFISRSTTRMELSTFSLLKKRWSVPDFQSKTITTKQNIVSFIRSKDSMRKMLYLDHVDHSLVYWKDFVPMRKNLDISHVLDIDFQDEHHIWIAHYCPKQRGFTVTTLDMEHSESELVWKGPYHRFPILGMFFEQERTRIVTVSSDGIISTTKIFNESKDTQYIDVHEPIFCVRREGERLFLLTLRGITVFDLQRDKVIHSFETCWKSPPSCVAIHSLYPEKEIKLLVGSSDGSTELYEISVMDKTCSSTFIATCKPWHLLDCYLDAYKFVLARSDGWICIGDATTLDEWYTMPNIFDPHHFRRMEVTHQRILLDAPRSGKEWMDWFEGNKGQETPSSENN